MTNCASLMRHCYLKIYCFIISNIDLSQNNYYTYIPELIFYFILYVSGIRYIHERPK